MADQGWFESDEDYQSRVTEEANEKTIEDSTGSAPSQGWFESEGDYRDRIAEEANERVIEDSTGSAPSQGWFESSADYRDRVAQEANERIVESQSGSAPSQGWFESNDDYDVRVRREANEALLEVSGESPAQGWFETDREYRVRIHRESREQIVDGATETVPWRRQPENQQASGSDYASSSSVGSETASSKHVAPRPTTGTQSNDSGFGWVILLVGGGLLVFALSTSKSSPAPSVPDRIVDNEICPYEGCSYGQRWRTEQNTIVYLEPPSVVGYDLKTLPSKTTLKKGTWVTTATGLVLANRRDGQLPASSQPYRLPGGGSLAPGQTVPIYHYVGEGCWRAWTGRVIESVCADLGKDQESEWWVALTLADGSRAWTNAIGAFRSQDHLNNALGEVIQDTTLTIDRKVQRVRSLLGEGSRFDGGAGPYGITAMEAAIRSKDVELVRSLIPLGLDLTTTALCPADNAVWVAMDEGGASFLDFLLENGLDLRCQDAPPLTSFLRAGVATDNYRVDRALEVVKVLIRHGASLEQRDKSGQTMLEALKADWREQDERTKSSTGVNASTRRVMRNLADQQKKNIGALELALAELPTTSESQIGGLGEDAAVELTEATAWKEAVRPGTLGLILPRVIEEVKPRYTSTALSERIAGSVWLECIVGPDGLVSEVRVTKSLDSQHGLDDSAVTAARQWRFVPGQLNGSPVPVLITIELTFTVRE